MSPPADAPGWLLGVWRRQSIAWPDGRRDDTTLVYWLQAGSAFADIRLPVDPGLAPQGFAGQINLEGDICTWQREIDIAPAGAPDIGRLRRPAADRLREEGVLEPYVEEWQRIDDGAAGRLVLRRAGGILVQVGGHLLQASPAAVDYAAAGSGRVARSTDPARVGLPLAFRRAGEDLVDRAGLAWHVAEATDDPLFLLTGGSR